MCRSKAQGGRRCNGRYTPILDYSRIRDNNSKLKGFTCDAKNVHRQPVRLAANHLRQLKAEQYHLNKGVYEAEDILLKFVDEKVAPPSINVVEKTGNYDSEGIEERLTPEQLEKVQSMKFAASYLKEKYPDVYDELHAKKGKNAKVVIPDAETEEDYASRYDRMKNPYTKELDNLSPVEVAEKFIEYTRKQKEVTELTKDCTEGLTNALPSGTVFEPYKQKNPQPVAIYDTFESVTAARLNKWVKNHPDPEYAKKVAEDVKQKKIDTAKVRRLFPNEYSEHKKPSKRRINAVENNE